MPEFLSSNDTLLITAFLAYLLGSIPFGVVITRLMGLGDLRQIGSGNIGATNVLRTGRKGLVGRRCCSIWARGWRRFCWPATSGRAAKRSRRQARCWGTASPSG